MRVSTVQAKWQTTMYCMRMYVCGWYICFWADQMISFDKLKSLNCWKVDDFVCVDIYMEVFYVDNEKVLTEINFIILWKKRKC